MISIEESAFNEISLGMDPMDPTQLHHHFSSSSYNPRFKTKYHGYRPAFVPTYTPHSLNGGTVNPHLLSQIQYDRSQKQKTAGVKVGGPLLPKLTFHNDDEDDSNQFNLQSPRAEPAELVTNLKKERKKRNKQMLHNTLSLSSSCNLIIHLIV